MNPDVSSEDLGAYLLSLGFHPVLEYTGNEKYFKLKDDGTEFWVVSNNRDEDYQVGWEKFDFTPVTLYEYHFTCTALIDGIIYPDQVKGVVDKYLPEWLNADTTNSDYLEAMQGSFKHD